MHFLMSRYGIKVTEQEVRQRILGAFGECPTRRIIKEEPVFLARQSTALWGDGNLDEALLSNITCKEVDTESGRDVSDSIQADYCSSESDSEKDDDDDGSLMDLTQVLALLLIPLLLKARQSLSQQREINHSVLSPSFAVRQHCERGDKRWPDADLIENVLCMMLFDATGDPTHQPLTKELISQLLSFYSEGDIAQDDRLLEEMLAMAKSTDCEDDEEPILFDQHAFSLALTRDCKRYCIDYENEMTTNYFDVFQTLYSTKVNEEKKKCSFAEMVNPMKNVEVSQEEGVRPVQSVFTFPSIDYTADTFRSKVCQVTCMLYGNCLVSL